MHGLCAALWLMGGTAAWGAERAWPFPVPAAADGARSDRFFALTAYDAAEQMSLLSGGADGRMGAAAEAPVVVWPTATAPDDWWSRPHLVPGRLLASAPWLPADAAPTGAAAAAGRADDEDAPEALMARVRAIFESEGVPSRWIWIAEAESLLDPAARSARGAVGLFQLMPETARRFGLAVQPVDDRCVPEKNARAAARYLKTLHRQFGCWSLALAAYNAGEGRVRRILKQYDARSFAEIARYLPRETRGYVPRVLALVEAREERRPARAAGTDATAL